MASGIAESERAESRQLAQEGYQPDQKRRMTLRSQRVIYSPCGSASPSHYLSQNDALKPTTDAIAQISVKALARPFY